MVAQAILPLLTNVGCALPVFILVCCWCFEGLGYVFCSDSESLRGRIRWLLLCYHTILYYGKQLASREHKYCVCRGGFFSIAHTFSASQLALILCKWERSPADCCPGSRPQAQGSYEIHRHSGEAAKAVGTVQTAGRIYGIKSVHGIRHSMYSTWRRKFERRST